MATKKETSKAATGTKPAPKAKAAPAKGVKDEKAVASAVTKAAKPSISLDAPSAVLDKFITSIKTRGAKLDNDIHSAACACLNHVEKHGDYTLMNRLITAMPKTVRRNALVIWALAFGKVKLNDDKATLNESPLVFDKTKTTQLDAAIAKPFWEFRNVREGGSQWLYMDFIGNVMKTLARVAIDTNNPEHAKAKAALDALNAVNEALNTTPVGAAAPTQPAQAAALPAGQVERRIPATAH